MNIWPIVTPVVLLVIMFLVLSFFGARMCPACQSSKMHKEIEKSLEWGTNVGGLMKSDPYFLYSEYRVCEKCGERELLKSWIKEVSMDESVAKKFEEEVMAMDFTPREPRPPQVRPPHTLH